MNGEVWDGMLNQTNIGKNANKCIHFVNNMHAVNLYSRFYVLQLLHPTGNNSSCILHTRWGRVGESGQKLTKVRRDYVFKSTVSRWS
jgi:poly [ADP-ribose] polymerase